MRKKRIGLLDIIGLLGDSILDIKGPTSSRFIDNLADANHVSVTSLDWINPTKTEKQKIAECSIARVLLVDSTVRYSKVLEEQEKTLIVVENPKYCLALIGNCFFVNPPVSGIHSTAIINSEAKIGEGVSIGAYCVIGKAVIGDGSQIDSGVRIYDDVVIGQNCVIQSGAVLGGAGFGFEKGPDGNLFRFPQIGQLIIGDYVEIGANTCIDRGALSDTVIGSYTKINNLCHIAHNNIIGNNVVVTACVNISGSNIIEDDAWIAPNASLRGYIRVGKGSTVGMAAVVTKDIPSGEIWVGNPAHKLEK